jgi:hypothetical protein
MNTKLLDTFLSEDGDAYARHKLLDAIRKQRATGTPLVSKFTFNRFNVTLDYEAKTVSLQDDLAVDPDGEYNFKLDEFEKAVIRIAYCSSTRWRRPALWLRRETPMTLTWIARRLNMGTAGSPANLLGAARKK